MKSAAGEDDDELDGDAGAGAKPDGPPKQKRGGRQPLARHLKRERIVHDLAEAEKHCEMAAARDLRLIAEEISERYEYIPASIKVIQDVCLKYACDRNGKDCHCRRNRLRRARLERAYWRK